MDIQKIENILKQLNPQAAAGKSGFDNRLISWMVVNNNYDLARILVRLINIILKHQLPAPVRKILLYSSGVFLGKEKHGVLDYDVRPIVVTDTLIRILDKLVIAFTPTTQIRDIIGPYQSIGERRALEMSGFSIDQILRIQKEHDDICLDRWMQSMHTIQHLEHT